MPVSWFGVNVSVVPEVTVSTKELNTSGLKQKEMNSRQWGDSTLICLLLKHYTLQRDVHCLYITLSLRRFHLNKID